jgi:hypothetical protein
MATKDEMMKAAKAFWGPLKVGADTHIADIKIHVLERGGARNIRLNERLVAGYWEASDIRLLQLNAASKYTHKENRGPIAELIYWIVAESKTGREERHGMMGPPDSIVDMITVEHDKETGKTWLLGELYDDRVEIKSEWEPEPFRVGQDGLHARWMDGHETWLELSAEPMAEYDRVLRRPIEAEEVPEIPTSDSKLDKLQAAIDDIERDIRQLRAKEHDFTSTNIEMARRVGKQNEYEELLRQRDEHMWRGNPKLPARFDKSILVGATPDQIVQVEVNIGDDSNRPEHQSLSFSGTTYSRSVFTAETGEERAKEYLEDGELWRDAVTHQQTTKSLEDWSEDVINADGWEQVLGDVTQIGDDAFIMSEGGGQIDMDVKSDSFVELAIAKKDARAIWAAWKKYHLKPLSLPEVAGTAAIMRTIFEKYPAFKPEQMLKLTDMAPIEPEVEEEKKVAETKIDTVQKQIDAMELQIAEYRKANKDFDSTPIEVADKLGTRQKFEALLKQRDELMWRGNPIKNLSADTMKMVRAGEGFRCESYGGSGSRVPSKVVRFEYEELNNDMTDQMIEALSLPTKLTPEQVFERIKQDYDDKYDAVWLATEEEVKEHYCDGDEPEGYNIPPGAIVLQDLGNDGALFLLPKQRENPIGPFTATWPSEPSHESSPAPPMSIPTEWWDEDGRVIEAKHEEEFVDLLIDKFWRRDILNDEVVETNGAFWGEHNTEQGYEWAGWRGEYRLGIIQYGDSASGPVAALRLSLRINAIDIASRIVTIERIDDKLVPIDRLFIRQSHEAVAKGGQYFASKADEMPLAIAIDKTHFLLRKLILRGAKMYPILEWVEVSTMTKGGVDPKMELVAIHPDGSRFLSYKPIDIPGSNFYYDDMIEKGYGLYINLEGAPSTASATPALDHLGHGARMNKELDRIFISDIQVDVEELPIEPTAIAGIQERVDSIEREIRMLRAKEKDFDSSNSEVAARLGKQEEYDKLMRERDEQMWRGNPGERRVITKEDMRKRAKLPKLLYHGTSIQNMHKVLREGLLVHQPQSAYTVESQHQEDTNLNVSLANTVQDAVFFSLGAAGWGADQAIIEFDTTDMPEEKYPAILRRPLFGKTGRFEYKFYTMKGIPPERISRVLIRSFEKPAGRLEVVEKWYTREEALSLPR